MSVPAVLVVLAALAALALFVSVRLLAFAVAQIRTPLGDEQRA